MRYSTSCSHDWDHAREEFLSIAKEQAREQSLQIVFLAGSHAPSGRNNARLMICR